MFTFLFSVLGANALTQWYKTIQTKYGDTKIHVALGVLSIVAALAVKIFGGTELFQSLVANAVAVFASALTLYHVVWKQLSDIGITDTDLSS